MDEQTDPDTGATGRVGPAAGAAVHVEELTGGSDTARRSQLAEVVAMLTRTEAAGQPPLVDEAERVRLEAQAAGGERPTGWRAWTARREGRLVGYASFVAGGEAPGIGDLGVPRDERADGVLAALAGTCVDAAGQLAADTHLWARDLDDTEVETLTSSLPVAVQRRLGVLGRRLDEMPPVVEGPAIRAYHLGADDPAVVEVLAAAYAGTDDGGWDLERFRERRDHGWFDPADLLLALDGAGRPVGLHWLKRRDATTGEVYNLAVHPRGQGSGAGPALLSAGLRHLHARGCQDVLLWVDLANERAVRLYTAQGFTTRWMDVALSVRGSGDRPHA